MKNFARSILNYFAAFNETRFGFNRKLSYAWTDDLFTLELSVFPDFQKQILNAVAEGKPFELNIRQGQHAVDMFPDQIKAAVLSVLDTDLDAGFLQECEIKAGQRLAEAMPDAPPQENSPLAAAEAMREFNLAFRKRFLDKLTETQAGQVKQLQMELGFSSVPPSSFNPQREAQHIFDDLQKISRGRQATAGYVDAVADYIRRQPFKFTIFDLHLTLRQYLQFINLQSVYIFFHEIARNDQKYPVFCVEVEIQDGQHAIVVRSARDVLMLNTAAINSFEFDTILTAPRACRFDESVTLLQYVERFLQAKFSVSDNFILTPHFRPLIAENLPALRFRVGIQAVKDEDRRLLDYSELITTLDTGVGKKFTDLISQYVDGNVPNNMNVVERDYHGRYPKKSSEQLAPRHLTVPLRLNEKQKKILTAVENEANRVIVVDGPPGTGKSYAITAMVYLAAQLGKSVVITSHKKQALDVIDQALTEQFKQLHPRAKPSVMRLESGRGAASLNNMQNSLSSAAINGARSRAQEVNEPAVAADRERLRAEIEKDNAGFWEGTQDYGDNVRKTLAWAQAHEALFGADSDPILPPKLPAGVAVNPAALKAAFELLGNLSVPISLPGLAALHGMRDRFPDALRQCEALQRIKVDLPPEAERMTVQVPPEMDAMAESVDTLCHCLDHGVTAQDGLAGLTDSLPTEGLDTQLVDSFADLRQACELLEKIEEEERAFLGKLLKRKTITRRMNSLAQMYPKIASRVRSAGAAAVLTTVRSCIKAVERLHAQYPALAPDYILAGANQPAPSLLKELASGLHSLKYEQVNAALAMLSGSPAGKLPLARLQQNMNVLRQLRRYQAAQSGINDFARHLGLDIADLPAIFRTLQQIGALLGRIQPGDLQALELMFLHYGPILKRLGVDAADLAGLSRVIANREQAGHLLQYIQLHAELSSAPPAPPPDQRAISDFFAKNHKLLERQIDLRLSNLAGYAADVQRIQTAIAAGKRISPELARVLLRGISCIIAEPGLISRHFPMEADMIDILIIDEASQVSIAESISLMLRARQTIVLGDELQYGAVGAVNVSERYAECYFRDILKDFARDRRVAMTEAESATLAHAASAEPAEAEMESSRAYKPDSGTMAWLKTFSVRTSTLAFAKAIPNYSDSLNVHFRSFPEIISYSTEVFYKERQIEIVPNRIRTKPIQEVLRFIKVETKGMSGRNVNLDEIESIQHDIETLIAGGYKGSIGVICSFREQADRMAEVFQKQMPIHPDLCRHHRFKIWFVGDVQGEERDTIYYSFVQDKRLDNADLRTIYPVLGGTADNINNLRMQRLNVGFSRARDVMVFVHSMPLEEYNDTRLGYALRHYDGILHAAHDHYVSDESVFGSPAEKELYRLILQTPFFQRYREQLKLIAQFEIGKYIRDEYHRNIPRYRVDFLLTRSVAGKESSLIIEYDGVEFHTRNPDVVTKHNFDQEYLEYDTARQLELESYGYAFLRINKFSLLPEKPGETPGIVLDRLLEKAFA